MERIKTDKLVDNEPLFITHYFKKGTLTLLLHKENQDLSNFFNVYGFLIIEPSAPKPYNGIYLSNFYIQPQKETDNLKGMGKYMLCLAIAIYIKYYDFDYIYLRAKGEFQSEVKERSSQEIYNYILENGLPLHYDIKELVPENIDKNIELKNELVELLSKIDNNKKLIDYYSREYGFIVVDDKNPLDVIMKSNLQLLKEKLI